MTHLKLTETCWRRESCGVPLGHGLKFILLELDIGECEQIDTEIKFNFRNQKWDNFTQVMTTRT